VRRVGQRRSTWVGVVVVVTFFAGVTLAFAWLGGGPDIPHPVGAGRSACAECHPTDGLPDDHRDRVDDSCRSCHAARSADASPVGGYSVCGAGLSRGRRPKTQKRPAALQATGPLTRWLSQTGGLALEGMTSNTMIVMSGKKMARMTQSSGLRPLLAASRNVK
jgi:hypothetical protein